MASSKKKKDKKQKQQNKPAEKKPIIIRYDKDGNRIGDDGYVMTPTRTLMHRVFNAFLVFAGVLILYGCFCTVMGYAQGADYQSWELIATGGTQFHGWDLAILLRMEAVFCVVTFLLAVVIHFKGFRWFYDRKPEKVLKILLYVLLFISLAFLGFAVVMVNIPDPLSIINIALCVICLYAMGKVKKERPTLKKAKVATTVQK